MSDGKSFRLVRDGEMSGDTTCRYTVQVPCEGVPLSNFINVGTGSDTFSFTLDGQRLHLTAGDVLNHSEWLNLAVTGGTAIWSPYGGGFDYSLTVGKPLPKIDKVRFSSDFSKFVDSFLGEYLASAWMEGFKAGVRTAASSIDLDQLADSAVNPYERSK